MAKFIKVLVITICLFNLVACGDSKEKQTQITASEAQDIAVNAYIYGYSLITSEITRIQMTNVSSSEEKPMHAPMGTLANVKKYPPADYRGVTAPNADTLYSVAWLDVTKEPWVFSHPDMGNRYYLMPIYSVWTDVIKSPGTRTTGDKAATYAITGPTWQGTLPDGVTEIKSPTGYAFILGRTYSTGNAEDYATVNALQEQFKVYPLSYFGKQYTPPSTYPVDNNPGFSMTDKPQDVISKMDTAAYFNMLSKLLGNIAPPAATDAELIAQMAKIGIVPGQEFNLSKLDPTIQPALTDVPKLAFEKITLEMQDKLGFKQNGWQIPRELGAYGTNYLLRAAVAAFGWGANLTADAIYPSTTVDTDNNKLTGANKYTMHFAAEKLPPVKGFWSITMYTNDSGLWFYPNPLNKFTVSIRDNLKFNSDGSLDLYFQHESPGADKESNWLPAPAGEFTLMLRMYWPSETEPSILPPGKGTWEIPGVIKKAS